MPFSPAKHVHRARQEGGWVGLGTLTLFTDVKSNESYDSEEMLERKGKLAPAIPLFETNL